MATYTARTDIITTIKSQYKLRQRKLPFLP